MIDDLCRYASPQALSRTIARRCYDDSLPTVNENYQPAAVAIAPRIPGINMEVQDVTPLLAEIKSRQAVIDTETRNAVDKTCSEYALLGCSVKRVLEANISNAPPFRLLPLIILGAYGQRPDCAFPISVMSQIWWAGAETLDDITDDEFDDERMGMPVSQALIACTACLSLLPQKAADLYAPSAQIATAWRNELMGASLECANGQLGDVAGDIDTVISWQQTMRIYAGKTGAPYARDAAMSALLAQLPGDLVRGWRAFGYLFGVLRQLANDRADDTSAENADLANGTPTLLLAHAFGQSSRSGQERLLSLHCAARTDVAARCALIARLAGADLIAGYNGRLDVIGGRLAALLDRLAPASGHRDLLHWMIRFSTFQARLRQAETAQGRRSGGLA